MKRLALLSVLALLLTACGSPPAVEEKSPKEVQIPQDVSAATTAKRTARTYIKQTMTFEGDGAGSVTMTAVGTIDFETLKQSAIMTTKGTGTQGGAIAQQTGTMELVGEGLVVYMKSPMFQRLIPGAKEWVRMDMQALGEEMGMDMSSLMQTNQTDPTAPLDYLQGLEEVEIVGQEEVHGAETTHYKGHASFEKLKETLSSEGAASIEQLQQTMKIDGFDVEAWIGEDGAARRLDYTYEALPMAGMSGSWNMVLEFFDFGTKVNVKVPPPSKVTDMLEYIQEMKAGADV